MWPSSSIALPSEARPTRRGPFGFALLTAWVAVPLPDPPFPDRYGTVVVDRETTDRFLYDYRKTVSELFIESTRTATDEVSSGACRVL